jgi:tetratricopeptide (TPR) repeat protein
LLWGIVYFVLDKNPQQALKEIEKCKDQRDPNWRYSRAFLLAYIGRLNEARIEYEKAFDRGGHESLPLQCEGFIAWVLSREPEKTQLYYCLGLINWKAKGDLSQAICDMEKFISQSSDAEYSEIKQLARANLGTIKGELKEAE